jgi:vitellogenic carboxypeptidase-like protein
LEWNGSDGFLDADRVVWKVLNQGRKKVGGYVTEFKNLRRVEMVQAGHLAPMDNPVASLEMMISFVNKKK